MEIYTFYPNRKKFDKIAMPISNIRIEFDDEKSNLYVYINTSKKTYYLTTIELMMDTIYSYLSEELKDFHDPIKRLGTLTIYTDKNSDIILNMHSIDEDDKIKYSVLRIVYAYLDSIYQELKDFAEYYYNEGYLNLVGKDESNHDGESS